MWETGPLTTGIGVGPESTKTRLIDLSLTNREIKLNGFFHGIVTTSRHPIRTVANEGVVAVYDLCRPKIILHVRQASKDRIIFFA